MKKLLLFLLMIFTCGNIYCQTWQSFGVPPGSGVTDMVYWKGGGANFSDKVWVSTSSYNWPTGQWGGVYYSATTAPYQGVWYQVAAGYIARTLAVGQDGNLYASIWYDPAFQAADGLYRFTPQVGVFGILYQASSGDNIFSIAVKNTPHTIFAGTRNGVIRSTDNGVSFGYSNTGIPDSAWVYDIAIDSSGILAIASSKGVFVSSNNGDNWLTTTGISSEDTATTLLFIDDTTSLNKTVSLILNDDQLDIGAENKLLQSYLANFYSLITIIYLFTEDEEQVEDIVSFLGSQNKSFIATRPGYSINKNITKVGDIGGVYESTDDGNTWNQINSGLPSNPPVSALAIKVYSETSAELYAGLFNDTTGGAGVYKLAVTVGVENDDSQIPSEYNLEQNYPNPFNPTTTIQFSIPEQSFVKLEVFNALGEKVSTLVEEELTAGSYKYEWNAESATGGLTSGIYFYKLSTNNFEQAKKLVLLK